MLRLDVAVDSDGRKSVRIVHVSEANEARGLLGNEIVGLGAERVRLGDTITTLQTRVKGKQIGRDTPAKIRLQREKDLQALQAAEERLATVEGREAGLIMLRQEVFGGP